jgi:hypothetical protein
MGTGVTTDIYRVSIEILGFHQFKEVIFLGEGSDTCYQIINLIKINWHTLFHTVTPFFFLRGTVTV